MRPIHLIFAVFALVACKDKTPTPVASDKPADKPADPPAAPADKPAEVPAAKPAEPAVAAKPGADGWTTYTSKEGKYTIEFPTPPKEQGMMVMSEFGATDADKRTSGCGMATAPVPNKDAVPKTMLDAMVAGYKADAKVLEEKDITIDKHPGRHLVIENEKHRKWIRVYVVDDKLYINNCGAPFDRGAKDAATAKRVLESFKLTKS
jgi:hypothetical protein